MARSSESSRSSSKTRTVLKWRMASSGYSEDIAELPPRHQFLQHFGRQPVPALFKALNSNPVLDVDHLVGDRLLDQQVRNGPAVLEFGVELDPLPYLRAADLSGRSILHQVV